jgi:hypothetical protein
MTTPPPVPPQRWESTFISHANESLQAVLEEARQAANTLGTQGWEIVGSSVQRTQVAHRFKDYDKGGERLLEWSIVCTLKRPVPAE